MIDVILYRKMLKLRTCNSFRAVIKVFPDWNIQRNSESEDARSRLNPAKHEAANENELKSWIKTLSANSLLWNVNLKNWRESYLSIRIRARNLIIMKSNQRELENLLLCASILPNFSDISLGDSAACAPNTSSNSEWCVSLYLFQSGPVLLSSSPRLCIYIYFSRFCRQFCMFSFEDVADEKVTSIKGLAETCLAQHVFRCGTSETLYKTATLSLLRRPTLHLRFEKLAIPLLRHCDI